MNAVQTVRALLLPLVLLLLSGCVAYRPRMLQYDTVASGGGGGGAIGGAGAGVRVSLSTGDALMQEQEDGPWKPVPQGAFIPAGSLILTEHGELILELPDNTGQVTLAEGTCMEIGRADPHRGTLLILSSGRVSGSITGTGIELLSTCGGALTLTPHGDATAPFEFTHGYSAEYVKTMLSLGHVPDWAIFRPGDLVPIGAGGGAMLWGGGGIPSFRTPVIIPEPGPLALAFAGLGALVFGVRLLRK